MASIQKQLADKYIAEGTEVPRYLRAYVTDDYRMQHGYAVKEYHYRLGSDELWRRGVILSKLALEAVSAGADGIKNDGRMWSEKEKFLYGIYSLASKYWKFLAYKVADYEEAQERQKCKLF